MANGKNVSMFASYPQSAAWELAHTFVALLFLDPFFRSDGTDAQAARAQAKALVKMLRLVGEIKVRRLQNREQNRVWRKLPIDWMQEADRVEGFARESKWYELIDWAKEIRGQMLDADSDWD